MSHETKYIRVPERQIVVSKWYEDKHMFIHMLRILQGFLSLSALVVKYRLQLLHSYLTNVLVLPTLHAVL
jgi:hypothetical protein